MRNRLRQQLAYRFSRLHFSPAFFLAGVIAMAALVSWPQFAQAGRVTYEYDDGGRLKKATYPNTSATEYKLDAAGNRTNVVVSPPDTLLPSSPGAVSFSGVTHNAMTVNWGAATDNVGVVGYDYQVNTGAWQSLGNVLTVSLTGLTSSTSYTVKVRARDAAGNVSATPSSSTTTTPATPDTTLPSSPGAVSFSSVTSSSMTVSWGAATDNVGVTGYSYQVNGGAWQSLGNVLTTNLTGLSASTSYTVAVRARDAAGNVSATPSSNTTTTLAPPDTTAPSVPTGLTATAASSQQINLSWNASTDTGGSGLAGYRVYRNGSQITTTSSTSYSDTGLAPNTTYTYTVAAYDGVNNVSSQSASVLRATLSDTTPPSVPVWSGATVISSTQINLSWNTSTDTGGSGMGSYRVYRNATLITTTSSTSYSDTGLAPNTFYSYALVAVDQAGNASAQTTDMVIQKTLPDTTAPSVPTGVSATAVGSQQINVSWSAATDSGGSGLAGYRVYRNGTEIAAVPSTSYSDTGVSPSTAYTYRIAAYDVAGNNSAQSIQASATTPADTTAPSVPTGLSATAVSSQQINLSWNASTDTGGSGLAGYRLYRNGTQITTTSSTSYSDTGLASNTTYTYTVAAYDGANNVSSQSASVPRATLSDTTPPSVPVWSGATVVSDSQINLSWNASTDTGGSGLAGYRVYRSGTLITTTSSTSYSDTGLTSDTFYSYALAAVDQAGNASAQTTDIVVLKTLLDSTPPSVPGNLSAVVISPSQIDLSWTASTDNAGGSGMTGYRVYRNGTLVASPVSTSYSDIGLIPGTLYNYSVHAYDARGNTSSPNTASATTLPAASSPGILQFSTNRTIPVGEQTGWVTITVTRTGASGTFGPASVTCSTSDGNAIANVDYLPMSQTLNWAAGDDTPKTCQASALDENTVPQNSCGTTGEPNGPSACLPEKGFVFNLSNASGASLGTITKALGVIVDDEAIGW